MLEPPFQELILQGELPHQALQSLYPVLESPFLSGLVIELAPAVLLLSVELGRVAFTAHQLLNYLTLEF